MTEETENNELDETQEVEETVETKEKPKTRKKRTTKKSAADKIEDLRANSTKLKKELDKAEAEYKAAQVELFAAVNDNAKTINTGVQMQEEVKRNQMASMKQRQKEADEKAKKKGK